MRFLKCVLFAVLTSAVPAWAQIGVEGRVLTDDGAPVAGVSIEALGRENATEMAKRLAEGRVRLPLASVTSAADGSFRLTSKQGVAWVHATAEGYAPEMVAIEDDTPIMVTLKRAALKRGVITAGGQPVAGAQVTWISFEGGERHVKTGADGAFEAPDPAIAPGQLTVLHPDYSPRRAFASGADSARALDQKLEGGVVLHGSAIDQATQKPVAGATIWVDDAWPLSRTDASGAFTIPHAPGDWTTVTARTQHTVGNAGRKSGPLVISLSPGRSLAGAIVDAASRKPVEGATVTVTTSAGTPLTAATDSRGQYTITGLPPGRYQPSVERPGYTPGPDSPRNIDLRTAQSDRFDLAITRLQRLEGRVVDEQRRPVEGALVSFGFNDTPHVYSVMWVGSTGASTRTGKDGAFRLTLPSGEMPAGMPAMMKDRPLVVLKQGFAAARAKVEPRSPKAAPIVVTLSRGVELSGRITNREGVPVADAEVTVAEDGSVGGSLMPTHAVLSSLDEKGWTRSDAAGRFVVRVHETMHHVAIRKAGYAPSLTRRHDPRGGRPMEVVLEPAVTLRGRVSRADGRGVAGVQTMVMSPLPMAGPLGQSAVTTADGSFEIAGLSAGVYRLSAHHAELGIAETRMVEAPGDDVAIVLAAAVTLRGHVLEAASRKPVTRFTITTQGENRWLSRSEEAEDANGAFEVADVPVGPATLTVTAEGYAARTISGLTLEAGVDSPPLEFLLETDSPIRGRITDAANAPIAEAQVSVAKIAGGEPLSSISAETDEQGEYELRGLTTGEVTLSFEARGHVKELRTVDPQKVSQLNVTLTRGLALKGEVVGAGGAGVPNVFVSATSSAQGATDQQTQGDERGRFSLEGLTPGRYTVSARTMDKGSAKLEDIDVETAGPLRLVLEQDKTAVLSGKVVGLPEGDDAGMSVVMAVNEETGSSAQATLDESRSFRMEDAPTGRVQVRAMAASLASGSTRMSRPVELNLAPGSQTTTVLEFSNDITISGTVTKDGAGVPFINVSFTGGADQDASTRTDARGAYQAVGLEPGRYRVAVSGDDVSFTTPYVVTASATLDLDITGGAIAGRVVRAEAGTPVAGVEVSFFRIGLDENTPMTSVTTAAEGAFHQRSIPEGRYRIITSKAGFGQEVLEVEVARGGTVEAVMEVTPADGLNVTVVDARDQRPLDAIVVVRDSAKRIVANRHAGVGADGALNIPLSSGAYSLSTSATGYGTATLKVTAPGQGLRIALTPGGTLVIESARDLRGRVRLMQPNGEEYVRCWCNGIADIELKGKRTVVENVTAGSYTVELIDEPGATPHPVVVIDGQRSTIVVN